MNDFVTEITRGDFRVTLEADHDSENPFLWGWEGLHVRPYDSRRMSSGDETIPRELEAWEEDYQSLMLDVDDWNDQLKAAGAELDTELAQRDRDADSVTAAEEHLADVASDLASVVEQLEEHLQTKPKIVQFDYRDYTVTVDAVELAKDWGNFHPDDDDWQTKAKKSATGLVETYNQWVEGDVFTLCAYRWNVEESDWEELNFGCLGGCYFNRWTDDDEVWQHAAEQFDLDPNNYATQTTLF